MGRTGCRAALSLLAALAFLGTAQVAHAETLKWQFRSEYAKIVDFGLYSASRRGYVWPGSNRVYVLDDYKTRTINITCQRGEKICFGAWVRNRETRYWGVGYGNAHGCKGCCYTCNGGQTRVIVLNP